MKTIAHVHSGTEHITCLVAAHVRHVFTDYDKRMSAERAAHGYQMDDQIKRAVRSAVQPIISAYLNRWRLAA